MDESPGDSPLQGLVGVEGRLIREDDVVPEVSRFFCVLPGPLETHLALGGSQTRLPSHLGRVEAGAVKGSTYGPDRNLAFGNRGEGRRSGGGLPSESQDHITLVSWAQEAMTTGGHLGDDLACPFVVEQNSVHSAKRNLQVVGDCLGDLALFVLVHNQLTLYHADSHPVRRKQGACKEYTRKRMAGRD